VLPCCVPTSSSTASLVGFLPSRDELAVLYANLKGSDFGTRGVGGQFQLLDVDASKPRTWRITSTSPTLGASTTTTKDFPRRVRAVRAF
jgi:hypothetical protein